MAESDIFCLRMQEFNKNIGISWQELQIEANFCDVTLACEDKQIKAHKVIISSCSPVLRNILKLNQNPHPLIYLRRVKYKDLQNLLNFMYQGEVNVAEEDLTSFLEVAEDLNIRGLSEGNKEGYNAKLKIPLQATHESTAKRKRTVEKIIIEDIKEANYIETSNEFGQACDNFADNESKISIKVVEILCRHYTLHSGSHQFILFTHKDLATSESGFSSEDIYTTVRNQPHTWYVLKSSALCA